MNILVTGGAGFLGTHIAKRLALRGDKVIVFDSLITSATKELEAFRDSVKLVQGDILDSQLLESLVKENKIQKIVHAAAVVGTPLSVKDPLLTAKINLLGSINIMELVKKFDLSRAVEISSEETYGAFRYEPADENHPLAPYSPYGITKVASEWYADYYHQYYGISYLTVKTSWVYGPGLRKDRSPRNFIRRALDNRPLELSCGGDQRIDHVYVEDLVEGIVLALDKENPKYRVYNIATGKSYSLREVVDMVKSFIPSARITIGPGMLEFAPGFYFPQKGAMDISRAASDLGYQPKFDLRSGLSKYIEHLRANEY
ncbi:MAG: hypothetical protein PWP65_1178 [Clostridia bacterium]|nr:hypothetical protein [Clostridia bacterium]